MASSIADPRDIVQLLTAWGRSDAHLQRLLLLIMPSVYGRGVV